MNWEAIGAVGEIIGGVAVIASLLFVGYQLRQGQNVERANAQREILKQGRDWFALTREDPELHDTVRSLIYDYDKGSAREQHLFYSWFWDYLQVFEQAYYMHRDGFLNDASFEGAATAAISLINTPGGNSCWNHAKEIWGEDARSYTIERLRTTGGDVPPFYDLWPHFGREIQDERSG